MIAGTTAKEMMSTPMRATHLLCSCHLFYHILTPLRGSYPIVPSFSHCYLCPLTASLPLLAVLVLAVQRLLYRPSLRTTIGREPFFVYVYPYRYHYCSVDPPILPP